MNEGEYLLILAEADNPYFLDMEVMGHSPSLTYRTRAEAREAAKEMRKNFDVRIVQIVG